MSETALTKSAIISELTRSPHGKLEEYIPVGRVAAHEDPDFFAHLVAWNHQKGQIRDAKVALPILALHRYESSVHDENALAHLADMNPRMFDKALTFARVVKAPSRVLRRLVERYLRDLELNRHEWERTAIQHRNTLKSLYARYHVKPMGSADAALFKGLGTGKFAVLRGLSAMSPTEIAGTIEQHKIPFMIARGALGAKAKDPDVVAALIARMSPTELVTNTKALERLGIKTIPALRAAFEAAIEKAGTSKRAPKAATLKTTRAAVALEDEKLSGKLRALQEKQLDNLAGIEGNWLVLGDKSGSMSHAIETSRQVAGVLARMVKGTVHLVFFDEVPRHFDVTGKSYEDILKITAGVSAGGGTSIGCGLALMSDKKVELDGIAVVSDGGENRHPAFITAYREYEKKMDRAPSVYFYQTTGDHDEFTGNCQRNGLQLNSFDLRGTLDYYSLPNLVQTMRVGRYSLLDEVFATPLRTLDEVLDRTKGMKVLNVSVGQTLHA